MLGVLTERSVRIGSGQGMDVLEEAGRHGRRYDNNIVGNESRVRALLSNGCMSAHRARCQKTIHGGPFPLSEQCQCRFAGAAVVGIDNYRWVLATLAVHRDVRVLGQQSFDRS